MMTIEELEKKIDYLTARVDEVSERLEAMHRGMSSQEYDKFKKIAELKERNRILEEDDKRRYEEMKYLIKRFEEIFR